MTLQMGSGDWVRIYGLTAAPGGELDIVGPLGLDMKVKSVWNRKHIVYTLNSQIIM